jgi:hypothetical protein
VRVLLTAGLLEPFDEDRARQVSSDGLIKKPFEASAVVAMVRPLVEAAGLARAAIAEVVEAEPETAASGLDPEMVRAAVTLAVDAAMPALVEGITKEVVERLKSHAR